MPKKITMCVVLWLTLVHVFLSDFFVFLIFVIWGSAIFAKLGIGFLCVKEAEEHWAKILYDILMLKTIFTFPTVLQFGYVSNRLFTRWQLSIFRWVNMHAQNMSEIWLYTLEAWQLSRYWF